MLLFIFTYVWENKIYLSVTHKTLCSPFCAQVHSGALFSWAPASQRPRDNLPRFLLSSERKCIFHRKQDEREISKIGYPHTKYILQCDIIAQYHSFYSLHFAKMILPKWILGAIVSTMPKDWMQKMIQFSTNI